MSKSILQLIFAAALIAAPTRVFAQGTRCSTDSLSVVQAIARLEWARKCSLTLNTAGPNNTFTSSRGATNNGGTLVGAPDYLENTTVKAYTGTTNSYEINYSYGFSRYTTSIYTVAQDSSGPTLGFWRWSQPAANQRALPLYPIFDSNGPSGSGIQLFPNSTLLDTTSSTRWQTVDCNLYQKDPVTGALTQWTGNHYVSAYCTSVPGHQFYTANFTGGVTPAAQVCTDWNDFRSRLDGNFTSVMLSGSANGTGISCNDPAIATQICNALHTGSPLGISCGGNTWNVGECGGTAVAVNSSVCACPASGASIARPCIANPNWGGMGTATCNGPTQSLEVRCMRGTETVYESLFSQGIAPAPQQCTSWNTFRSSIPTNADFVRLSGTADPVGVLCGNSTAASQICNALNTGSAVSGVVCGANTWNVGDCGGTAVAVNSSVCSCPASGASIARPCIANPNWGGMLTATCNGPSQSLRVSCGTAPDLFSNYFPVGNASAGLCTAWNNFRASLTGTYSKITLRGSGYSGGVTCGGANANTLCQALRTGSTVTSLACDGNTWNVGECGGTAVSVNSTVCSCPASGAFIARPCIANPNWGGMGTATCGSPAQSMDVICE